MNIESKHTPGFYSRTMALTEIQAYIAAVSNHEENGLRTAQEVSTAASRMALDAIDDLLRQRDELRAALKSMLNYSRGLPYSNATKVQARLALLNSGGALVSDSQARAGGDK